MLADYTLPKWKRVLQTIVSLKFLPKHQQFIEACSLDLQKKNRSAEHSQKYIECPTIISISLGKKEKKKEARL